MPRELCDATDAIFIALKVSGFGKWPSTERSPVLAAAQTRPINRGRLIWPSHDRRDSWSTSMTCLAGGSDRDFPKAKLSPTSTRYSDNPGCTVTAREIADRGNYNSAHRGPTLHRQADRTARNLRRSSGDRDRERPAVHRIQGISGTANCDERNSGCHRQLADRYPAGVGYRCRKRRTTLRSD